MPLVVRLGEPSSAVSGGRIAYAVQVDNTDPRPLNLTVSVGGRAAKWAQVQPQRLHVPSGGSGTARLWFDLPRTQAEGPGFVPFSVRVDAQQDPSLTTFVQGAIQLAPFEPLTARLQPKLATGAEGATVSVAITNHDVRPVDVVVTMADTRENGAALKAKVEPERLTVAAGATAGATVLVEAPVRPRLLARHHPLAIDVTGPDGISALAAGEFVQQPVVPRWTLLTPVVLVALLVAAIVFRPLSSSPSRRLPGGEEPQDSVVEGPGTSADGIRAPAMSPPTSAAASSGPVVLIPPSIGSAADRRVLAVLNGQVVEQGASGWVPLSPPKFLTGGEAHGPTWTPDDRVLYVLTKPTGSEVRLAPSLTSAGTLLVDQSLSASISPDGNWIAYVSCGGAHCATPSLVVRGYGSSGPAGDEVVQPLPAPPPVGSPPAWIKAGASERLVFVMGDRLAYLDVTPGGSGPAAVLYGPVDTSGHAPASPGFLDPNTAVFTEVGTNRLFRVPLAGGGAAALAPKGTFATLGLSGTHLVYLDERQNVCRLTTEGAAGACLTDGGGYADPSW